MLPHVMSVTETAITANGKALAKKGIWNTNVQTLHNAL
jgi:hypothetical protein